MQKGGNKMNEDIQQDVMEFDRSRNQLLNITAQKQQMQFQGNSLNEALNELEKTKEKKVYKAVGNILVLVPTETVKEVVKPTYLVKLKILGTLYSASGSTVAEAVGNLKVKNGKGVGLLSVICADKQKDKLLSRFLITRLFGGSRLGREIGLKQVSQLFDGL